MGGEQHLEHRGEVHGHLLTADVAVAVEVVQRERGPNLAFGAAATQHCEARRQLRKVHEAVVVGVEHIEEAGQHKASAPTLHTRLQRRQEPLERPHERLARQQALVVGLLGERLEHVVQRVRLQVGEAPRFREAHGGWHLRRGLRHGR